MTGPTTNTLEVNDNLTRRLDGSSGNGQSHELLTEEPVSVYENGGAVLDVEYSE
ncbi:hypothetical protein [Halorientalis sp.]|uniref:hypothetical protein n=1 Tax=Halorientalis sp. TaxID=1931229 RepID=UPI002613BB52|nr:hypothetical protein [Halorientalis sp.]